MSRPNEKTTRLYVGELPLIKNVIERLGLKEIFAKYIKTHKNEKIPAVDSLMMLLSISPAGDNLYMNWKNG